MTHPARRSLLTRRRFLGTLGLTLGGGLAAGWSRWIEPQWLETTHWEIPFFGPAGGPSLRLLHLSDLHHSTVVPLDFIERAFELGLKHRPHLVVLTGDFITGSTLLDPGGYQRVLRGLARRAACVAVLGNHDGGIDTSRPGSRPDHRAVRQLLHSAGIPVLYNETLTWVHGSRPVEIVGLGDLWSGQCHPDAAFPTGDNGWPRLVLCHNPDAKSLLLPYRWNALLCGHSHGGQLRIPFLGAPLAPLHDKRFAEGLHPWEGRWIYTTRGIGNLHGIRINCRPEVSILDLV